MTLDELKAALPPEMEPWVAEYGPDILKLTAATIKDYIERLIMGDTSGVYANLIDTMSNADLAAERRRTLIAGVLANKANAESIQMAKAAGAALGKILLVLLMSAMGF
jgi:hypothetical protein